MRWGILFCFFISSAPLAFALEPKLVLTAQENGTENQDAFSCSGTIHGYLVLPQRAIGAHQLEGIWTLPNGHVLEHSHIALDFQAPGRSTAYLWLSFPEESPLRVSLNPQAEETKMSYNGTWNLNVLWDHQTLLQSRFRVRCS